MINSLKHIIILLLLPISVLAQDFKGYRIEGDEVVFTFNPKEYYEARHTTAGTRYQVNNMDIENVVVAGNFNDWDRKKWKMSQIDENTYELRKKIADFDDDFLWEFKFVINGDYWAEPLEGDINRVKSDVTKLFNIIPLYHHYNLAMYTAYPSEAGNASFKLKGYGNAKKVILAGSFNKWDEGLFKMIRVDDGWELTLQLAPGVYEYKFIVDGHWMEDFANPNKKINEFGGNNSVIMVGKSFYFFLDDYKNAQKVQLSGSFNNWDEIDENYFMKKTETGWEFRLDLPPGKHHYKFIVDGNWITDPVNPVIEYDDKGNVNSVCMIK